MLHFGIREHAMGAILNGIKAHGGTRPYGGTFLTFSDYMRGAVRLSALMRLPVIYVWTHDSIGLGEDGPTHQPIEHIAALRVIPGLDVVRPSDANETAACWAAILNHKDRPAALLLSRQNLPIVPRGADGFADSSEVAKGGYILKDADGTPDVILIGTGSEVQYAVAAQEQLAAEGIGARVVSMPCREWFDEQDQAYRDSVIPPNIKARVSVEAGVSTGWRDEVGDARPDPQHQPVRRERGGSQAVRGVRLHRRQRGRGREGEHRRRRVDPVADPPGTRGTERPGRPRRPSHRHHQLTRSAEQIHRRSRRN